MHSCVKCSNMSKVNVCGLADPRIMDIQVRGVLKPFVCALNRNVVLGKIDKSGLGRWQSFSVWIN